MSMSSSTKSKSWWQSDSYSLFDKLLIDSMNFFKYRFLLSNTYAGRTPTSLSKLSNMNINCPKLRNSSFIMLSRSKMKPSSVSLTTLELYDIGIVSLRIESFSIKNYFSITLHRKYATGVDSWH